jgi:hypothetical protein
LKPEPKMFLRQLSLLAIKRMEGNNRNFYGNKTISPFKMQEYMNDDMMHSRNLILKF